MINFQVVLFFIVIAIVKTNGVLISSDLNNVFHHISDQILATIDDVFISLKITENFTNSKKIADNLILNSFMQNVTQNNYKKYEEIHNLSKTNNGDNKTAYFIFIINDMIEEFLMQEKQVKPLLNVKYYKSILFDQSKNNSQGIAAIKNTIDLVNFKSEFKSTVDSWRIKDIVYKLLFANPKKLLKRHEEPDLELWKNNMTSNLQTRRIFNGQTTSVEEFPFMVSIHIQRRFYCAGSIIRKDFVISAASCLRPREMPDMFRTSPWSVIMSPRGATAVVVAPPPQGLMIKDHGLVRNISGFSRFRNTFHIAQRVPHLALEVRVGSDFTTKGGELVPITEMYFHINYNHDSLSNNLVMLKLKNRLKFNKKIRRIAFDANAYKMPENAENILILGWGSINIKEKELVYSKPLSYAFVDVYNLQECKNVYSSFYVKDKNFCTGYVTKGSGACKNDIGGPAVVGSMLAGVISYGSPQCGQPDAPTVFTKLGYYTGWITSVFEQIIQQKSKDTQSSNIMSESESAEDANNITAEIKSLAQLVGELQVAENINSSLIELLEENQLEESNINITTHKNDPTSEEREQTDAVNTNIPNFQKSMSDESVSTPVNATIAPEYIKTSDAAEDEDAQNNESVVVYSKESEETTTRKNVLADKHFETEEPNSKQYLQIPLKLTTNADVDEYTKDEEWPSTSFGKEILSEMNISNNVPEYDNTGDTDNSTKNDRDQMIQPILESEDSDTSKVSGMPWQDLIEIIFLKRKPSKDSP